jgi:hypothetical protein
MRQIVLISLFLVACGSTGKSLLGSDSDSFEGGNQSPGMPGIALLPEYPSSSDDLVVEIVTPATDPDGDEVEYLVTWMVDGEELEGVETLTLENMFTRRGETWSVTVESFDGIVGGGMTGASVDIENSPPTIESITVSPMEIYEKTVVSCEYDEPVDLDNDVIQQLQSWALNGMELDVRGDLDGSHFDKGDVIECLVYADDGIAPLVPIRSEPITVLNTAPNLIGCGFDLEDNQAPVGEPVVVTSNGWVDDDDDPEGYIYDWYVNWVLVSAEATLDPELFNAGDNIYVEMTAWDGESEGNMERSPNAIGVEAP